MQKDFQGTEIKLNDKVFGSWGGKKHAIGRVSKFIGLKTIEITRIEKSTNPEVESNDTLVWRAEDIIVIPN